MLSCRKGPYTLYLKQDDNPPDPRSSDHLTRMVCIGDCFSHSNLWGYVEYVEQDHFLRDMYLDVAGHDERGLRMYERMVEQVWMRSRHFVDEWVVERAILNKIQTKYIIQPLGMTQSGLLFVTKKTEFPLSKQHIGWIYTTKEEAMTHFGQTICTAACRRSVENYMAEEADKLNYYLNGQCYGYELLMDGVLVQDQWGLFGHLPLVMRKIEEMLPDCCKGMTRCLESG